MTEYKTIYTARKYADKILSDLNELGWKLVSKQETRFEKNVKILGPYDDDDDRPLIALSVVFEDDSENAQELAGLLKEYLNARDKQLNYRKAGPGGAVAGIVFGSIISTVSLVLLFSSFGRYDSLFLTLSIIMLLTSLPAIPLCIWAVTRRIKSNEKNQQIEESNLEDILQKARDIKNNQA